MYIPTKPFVVPGKLSLAEQVEYLKEMVERFRKESLVLREELVYLRPKLSQLEKELERLKKQIEKQRQTNEGLKKERDKLKKEIERLTKTKNRYQVSLFDHGNFKSPIKTEKKPKGGQLNHSDTNREAAEDYSSYPRKRLYAKSCGKCGNYLKRVTSTRQKVLLDIKIQPEVVKLIVESERQWCGGCQREVNAKYPQSLPFSEYGLNTFMMVMILRFKAHCSLSTIAKVMEVSFGISLSKSEVCNLLKTAAIYLKPRYHQLTQEIRQGKVIYADETGWQVKGHSAWMWIMASEQATVYLAAESRGKGIAKDLVGNSTSYFVTDGLASYSEAISKDKHLYCWAHILRFSFEETILSKEDSMAVFLRDALVGIYHLKTDNPGLSKEKLEELLTEKVDGLLALASDESSFKNIQYRLKSQRGGLIKALVETGSGTNNLAERELRPLVLGRKISYGSDTYAGMETTAILASVIQSLSRDKGQDLLKGLKSSFYRGDKERCPIPSSLYYLNSS